MTIQTYARTAPPLSGALLNLDDLADLDRRHGEPRVYDFTLARALGYQHARNIRRLIKASRAELETHGVLIEKRDRTGGSGNLLPDGANAGRGHPGTAFYLNEAQALVICAVTRTSTAARVRGELIRVYMLWRARQIRAVPKDCLARLVPGERMALRSILAHADVVMAPPMHDTPFREGPFHYPGSVTPIGEDDKGHIPYILAPITENVLDTLVQFEIDEDGDESDYEPSLGGGYWGDDDREGDQSDDEDGGDCEPSLGSLLNHLNWAGGNSNDAEEQCDDEGDNELDFDGDEADGDRLSEDEPIFPRTYSPAAVERRAETAALRRQARLGARRIRDLIVCSSAGELGVVRPVS